MPRILVENVISQFSDCHIIVGGDFNARFYQLRINLGIANPRSEDNPRFILGSSFSVLSTFSNLGTTNLGITRLSL